MTAVEWLVEQIKSDQNQKALSASEWVQVIEQAKAMESEQRDDIINQIDMELALIEDYAKGEAGDEITKLRKYISETYGKE